MENLKKRWTVTYTKHIKQKRKVYQDGFMDLHISSNKVVLFDDCEKLLEGRILKGEEVVCSGETLTFNGYLVDVGDPEGEVAVDHKPISDLNLHGRDKKIAVTPRPSFMNRQKFRSPISSGPDDKKDTSDKSKAQPNNLSTSRRMIREFKKSELQRYGVRQKYPESPDTVKPGVTGWQVMYTTQKTQKAKKYHDGFLRLTNSGSLGRQIMLYDESKKLLDSRFLKKDEIIRSHESVVFDAHLVDIGEPVDLNVQENNEDIVGKEGPMHEHQNYPEAKKPPAKETGRLQNEAGLRNNADSSNIYAVDKTKTSNIAPTKKYLRDIHEILSILQKPIAQKSVVIGGTDKNTNALVSSAKRLQVSHADLDYSGDCQLLGVLLPEDGPRENKENRESSKIMDIEKSSCTLSGGQLSGDSEIGNSEQSHLDNEEAETKWSNASGFSSSLIACTPDDKKSNEQLKSAKEMDEWPTFDLGF